MDFGTDPIALPFSMLALWLAYREARRNEAPNIKIIEYGSSFGGSVGEQSHARFEFVIRNLGISLHDPRVQMVYKGTDGLGWIGVPLYRKDEKPNEKTEFSRGMIARFHLRSMDMDQIYRNLLRDLRDPIKQELTFILYSQGYEAIRLRVGTRMEALKFRYVQVAWNLNRGIDVVKQQVRKLLRRPEPKAITMSKFFSDDRPLYVELLYFIDYDGLYQDKKRKAS